MKRVVAIAVIMVMVTSLFAFPVLATTYNPSTYNTYSDSVTYNGVTYYVRVTQFKALSQGTSLLPGGMETIMFVQLQVTNNSSDTKACTIPKLSIDISDERIITDVLTYGGDFTLGLLTGGTVVFYPNSDFSLDNNKVIVPPGKSLSCVGAIGLPAQLNQTGDGTLDTGLRGAHLYDKSNYYVTTGDYSYGNPVDVTPLITYLDDIIDNQDDLILSIQDISDYLSYTGNYLSSDLGAGNFFQLDSTQNNVRTICRVYRGRSNYSAVSTYYNESDDTGHLVGTIRIPFSFYIQVNNPSNVQVYYLQYLNNLFPNIANSIHIESFYSDIYEGIIRNGNSNILLKVKSAFRRTGSVSVIPLGSHLTFMTGYFDIPADVSYTLPDMSGNTFATYWSGSNFSVVEGYYPIDEYTILKDLYLSMVVDSDDDNTEEAQDMNDDIHEKEQVWYDNNSDALEAVGLSNYRFSSSQSSGITQAVTQFQAVWNALGDWTNVYIFILILSISTYIIRHEPTTRVKQYRSSVQAERAERISYYAKKNAEARASTSGSTFKAALRRRK